MLLSAKLVRRYKRFLADVQLDNGEIITVHCPNTGSMKNCAEPGSEIWYSTSENPKRKYPNTWELIRTRDDHMIGVNTHKANSLVKTAITSGVITELSGYAELKSEVRYGGESKSRVDFVLTNRVPVGDEQCFVEVKSVTLLDEAIVPGQGLFPDAVSERASRHLLDLIDVVKKGQRAVLLFCVQHTGILHVSPADEIDPVYGETLREAMAKGVEVIAYRAAITPTHIALDSPVPVLCQ